MPNALPANWKTLIATFGTAGAKHSNHSPLSAAIQWAQLRAADYVGSRWPGETFRPPRPSDPIGSLATFVPACILHHRFGVLAGGKSMARVPYVTLSFAPWQAGLVFALLAFLFVGSGCSERNAYVAPPPPEVKVAEPEQRRVTVYLEFTGNTAASEMVQIRAQVQGYLDAIHFKDGDDVKTGDLLFVIDRRPFQAKFDEAKADLESAKAQATRSGAIYKRAVSLVASKAVAEEELDTKKGDWEVAKASVLRSEEHTSELQ